MGACAHAHGMVVARFPVGACGVGHGSWCIVDGAGHHADIWESDVVSGKVGSRFGPFYLFQAEYSFIVEDIGVCTAQAGGLVYTVIIKEESVTGACIGYAVCHLYGFLIVSVEKVDLETFDSHGRVTAACFLKLVVEHIEDSPEHDTYSLGAAVGDKSGQVDGIDDS